MIYRHTTIHFISIALIIFTLDWLDIPRIRDRKRVRRRPDTSTNSNNDDFLAREEAPPHQNNMFLDFFRELESQTGGILNDGRILNEIAVKYLLLMNNNMPPMSTGPPPPIHVDCRQSKYSHVLNGEVLSTSAYIIDIVAFGFDVDYLEIRLLEHYDLIDKFVLIEQNTTHRGDPKPFMLETLLQSERFKFFQDKIEYIQDFVPEAAVEELTTDRYALENRVRSLPIQHLRKTFIPPTNNNTHVYVLQNDGDEIISHHTMAHLKHCQLRQDVQLPIYTPALAFKRNSAWLQSRPDMANTLNLSDNKFEELRAVTWRHPFVWHYEDVLRAGSTNRRHHSHHDPNRTYNMGIATASHFSDPAHPILSMLKFYSVAEAMSHSFSKDFWSRIRNDNITNEDIVVELFRCKTQGEHKWHHISEFDEGTREFIIQQLPWAIRETPSPYPWLYSPGLFDREQDLFDRLCVNATTGPDGR